jgi:hypothetical protein
MSRARTKVRFFPKKIRFEYGFLHRGLKLSNYSAKFRSKTLKTLYTGKQARIRE